MKTQTKCTLSLSGLFILELLPIPLTVIYCLYVVRKRPAWLPEMVERLYSEKEGVSTSSLSLDGGDAMVTRRRCTISLLIMLLLDFLIPFTILFGFYVVRKRPIWFKNVVNRLYGDLLSKKATIAGAGAAQSLEQKYIDLQKSNIAFALEIASKSKN